MIICVERVWQQPLNNKQHHTSASGCIRTSDGLSSQPIQLQNVASVECSSLRLIGPGERSRSDSLKLVFVNSLDRSSQEIQTHH